MSWDPGDKSLCMMCCIHIVPYLHTLWVMVQWGSLFLGYCFVVKTIQAQLLGEETNQQSTLAAAVDVILLTTVADAVAKTHSLPCVQPHGRAVRRVRD
jgi:hypothetical protein